MSTPSTVHTARGIASLALAAQTQTGTLAAADTFPATLRRT